jgi:DNA-binding transcriptional ArsR family regulator
MSPDPAPIFAALGDPTRLALLGRLAAGEARSIVELASGSPITRQAVTKHLKVLEGARLVGSARIGRETRYELRPEPLDEARAFLDRVSAEWDARLGRLKRFVEGE